VNKKKLIGSNLYRVKKVVLVSLATFFAILFLFPTVVTIVNSFMSSNEISINYGKVFDSINANSNNSESLSSKKFVSKTVNIKLIPDMVSLKQYSQLFIESPEYLYKFWNSLLLVAPIVVFQLIVALLASYSFMRYRGRIKEIIFFIYIILMLMPYQVTMVPNFLVSKWLGIINTFYAIWLPGIISPFGVFLLTKYMRRIPSSFIESAKLDGAGEWSIFRLICVPLCKGALVSVGLLVFIDYWNMIEQPIILLSDSSMHPLSVFLSKINEQDIGLAFAVSTVYMIPTLLLFLYGEEYLVEGIAFSAGVKG